MVKLSKYHKDNIDNIVSLFLGNRPYLLERIRKENKRAFMIELVNVYLSVLENSKKDTDIFNYHVLSECYDTLVEMN